MKIYVNQVMTAHTWSFNVISKPALTYCLFESVATIEKREEERLAVFQV